MKKLKTVCFISMEYPEETGFGGIGTYVWHMARALTERGIRVTVFSYSLKEGQVYNEEGIHVIRKKLHKPIVLWWYFAVTRFLIQNKFDIVEDAEFLGSTFFYQLLFKNQNDFIHVKLHTPHAIVNYYEQKNTFFEKVKTGVMNYIESTNTKRANMISAPSEIMKQIIGVIWNIDEGKICIIPYPFEIRNKNIILPSIKGTYILYFGRLQLRKSADLLLHLIQKNFLKNKQTKFILIGKDYFSFKEKLQKINNHTAKNTILIDFVNNKKELYGYIQQAKAVFLPSKFDNLPLTNLESLWYNPHTYTLNNSGPLEIMARLGFTENVVSETELMTSREFFFEKNQFVPRDKIQKRIKENFGYKKIASIYIDHYENSSLRE